MGKIKKAAGPKHDATLSQALAKFAKTAVDIPLQNLSTHLATLPRTWPFPRGDLYHWIPLLNRFDSILEAFIDQYGLSSGPQTQPFGSFLLGKKETGPFSLAQDSHDIPSEETVSDAGGRPEADRELIEAILDFSRLLLGNCGNRSLYNSSDRLNELLNTTSLSLLHATLRLGVNLAQRYQSRQRISSNSQHFHLSLLASHYNIELDKIQKLAFPISRAQVISKSSKASSSVAGPIGKGKEKEGSMPRRGSASTPNPNDLIALCKEADEVNGMDEGHGKEPESSKSEWDVWGNVSYFYYPSDSTESSSKPAQDDVADPSSPTPATPTPVRRPSMTAPHQAHRLSRVSTSEDASNATTAVTTSGPDDSRSRNGRTVEISSSTIATMSAEAILADSLPDLPQSTKYDFLNKIRAAQALMTSATTRRQLLAIRILALTNLAYVYPEILFQTKVLQQDSDEPKRLQVTFQLAELVHSGGKGDSKTPQHIQTLAIGALEALTKHKSKLADVFSALNVNVNHGALLYVTRKTVADLAADVKGVDSLESYEWREALFGFLVWLPLSNPRTADALASAGLIPIFVDVLNLRSPSAERVYPMVMTYLDSFVHQAKDAFQTLATAKGLDAIADLTNFEVESAAESVARGEGLPAEYKTQMTDYDVPFIQQQSLRSLLKFVNHMMQHGGGNYDRLLRNLIDSPQLLSALRKVLENAPMFGSNVWSGVVNIMSSFIHNEPTSYNVISEAGLSKAFLETVMMRPLEVPEALKSPTVPSAPPVEEVDDTMDTDPTGDDDAAPADPMEELVQNDTSEEPRHREYKVIRPRHVDLAKGILPAMEAMVAIPQAFGAICLNAAGQELFRSSSALENFFEIFESPAHVKVMKTDPSILRSLGSSFDELVRHHPALKSAVMSSILVMVTRVGYKLRLLAWENGVGTKLWVDGENGGLDVSGGPRALYGDLGPASSDEDPETMDSSRAALLETLILPSGDKLVSGSDEDIPPLINAKGISRVDDSSGLAAQTYLSAVVKFLNGFFENQALCSAFVEAGGVEYVLDLATLPSLSFDFGETEAMTELAMVVHMMSEMKHHLVLPSLVSRTLDAVRRLAPLYQANTGDAFFEGLTTQDSSANQERESFSKAFSGTYYAKNLVVVQTLTRILHEVYQAHVFPSRPSQATYPFTHVNLGDMYSELVLAFGKLQAACVKNEILLQNSLSDSWKEATRVKGFGMGNNEADRVLGIVHDENVDPIATVRSEVIASMLGGEETAAITDHINLPNGGVTQPPAGEQHKAAFKNVQTLRYLFSTLPSSITSFFHALGKGLMLKRRIDSFQRQSASVVADALADALIDQLKVSKGEFNNSLVDQYAYWIVNLVSVSQLMIEKPADRSTIPQCVTMPLLAFQRKSGLRVLEDIAGLFYQEVNSSSEPGVDSTADRRLASAYAGLKIILSFFSQITTSRTIIDAPQTVAMSSTSDRERDKDKPDYFLSAQFLVELRMAVVPVATRMWHAQSEMVAKAPSSIAKCLVEILKSILDADGEKGAFKRNDNLPHVSASEKAVFKMNRERVGQLVERGGFEKSLAKEALFRCNNLLTAAEEYCKSFKPGSRVPRCPIPTTEIDKSPSRSLNTPRTQEPAEPVMPSTSMAAAPNDDPTLMTPALEAIMRGPLNSLFDPGDLPGDEPTDAAEPATTAPTQPPNGNETADPVASSMMSLGNILNGFDVSALDPQPQGQHAVDATPSGTPLGSRTLPNLRQRQAVRVEDLDAKRQVIRDDLIDRCLDVLNSHQDVTFELADLIAAALKSSKGDEWRIDTGNTLIYSLTSLQDVEDNFQPVGKKIAAYASLAALVLQDKDLYKEIKPTLVDTFPALLGFIKVFPAGPDTVPEDHSPWIGQILLIVEKLLSDDAEPMNISWDPSAPDTAPPGEPIARLEKEEVIPLEEKIELFNALVEVLPRIGKDVSLALSVARVLVMLTRNRKIATLLGEKRNLQRLFVMIKQIANTTNERLQSSFMLILRHIIEDEDTIRQIMRSEIYSAFSVRPGRPVNTTDYLRSLYHVALRAPEIFVEVTNEKTKIPLFEKGQVPQSLMLKVPKPEETTPQEPVNESAESSKPEEQVSTETAASVEEGEKQPPLEKSKTAEMKAPVVEHPDGVIHYLLSELLSYKDVEDKDTPKPAPPTATSGSSETQSDVEMTNGEGPPAANVIDLTPAVAPKKSEKAEKPEFKGEEHPIYIYRCFILQCLTELLSSYNRTKVEFINFSRKADPLVMTPSKPRSGVLNYLLNSLIPVGTLDHEDSIAFKKRSNTSSWAMRVIVALCSKTGEVLDENRTRGVDEESESDLLFVRKFVLGHALSAYKEASSSTESLDVKYARMMCIADLFDRMLTSNASTDNSYLPTSQRLLAKIMFEKNFITALTSSIADIDLNFPASKRAVKYILRPLNKLTQTAIILSESSSISTTPGQTDEDDISSASSVSSMEDEREETPDLFRNSTLGMFEQHHNEASSSESSEEDEEMYDDNYDDEMEYEEEGLDLNADAGDVISEEDELDVAGGMEGLPGDVPMNIEVVVDGDEDDEDEEDDSEDDEDSEDDDDEDVNDIGFAGEINGDDDNASLGEGHGEEWQSEEDDEEEEVVFVDRDDGHDGSHGPDSDHLPDIPHLENLLRAMGEEGGEIDQMELENPMGGQDMEFLGEEGPDEEDDEEDEEEMDEEDVAFEGEFGEDDRGLPTGTWGWELDEPRHGGPALVNPYRGSPWSIMPGGAPPHRVLREYTRLNAAGSHALMESLALPTYRTHRGQGAPRAENDGTNPLLRRADRTDPGVAVGSFRSNGLDSLDFVHALDPAHGRLTLDGQNTLMTAIMSAIGRDGRTILPPGGGIQFSLQGPGGERLQGMPARFQAILGMRPPGFLSGAPHGSRNDPSQAVTFSPVATVVRWQEESRILYSGLNHEKAQILVSSILRVLVPPAIEEEKLRKAEEEKELQRRVEAERIAKEEADRLKKEQDEKDAKEKEEREAREAVEAAEAEAAADAAAAAQGPEANEEATGDQGEVVPTESTEPMEGVEASDPDAPAADTTPEEPEASSSAEAGPSEQTPRVYTTIRGRQLDITDMQIDQEYLEALPEEIREEVIMQQLAEQRSQQAATGEEPSEINTEFLDALPPEIREELLQQEAQDRRRRERETNRRRATENGEPRAEEMDGASFMATLDPVLRQAVLVDQPEEVLARLGPEFVNEARALTGRRLPHLHDMPRLNRDRHHAQLDQVIRKPQRQKVVQMLDKAGVATLLRLMFMPQQGSGRQYLHGILHDVCENRQNRGEVVSLLLSILQDGSVDVNAVERSFAQLSLRAKQVAMQKTPLPLKRTLSMPTAPTTSTDMSPLMVVQQCLSTLVFLTQYNAHIAVFFLSPHESTAGLKSKTQRKGKGKEDKATKYALNALLTLLDRKLIMDSSSCMEQLSSLLSTITQPLTMLLRKDKEKAEETPKAPLINPDFHAQPGRGNEPPPQIADLPGFEVILGPLFAAPQGEPATRVEELTEADALADTPVVDATMTDAEADPVESIEIVTEAPAPPTEVVVSPSEEAQADTTETVLPANGEGEAAAVEKAEEPKKAEEEKPKKRMIEPPFIPEHNLRLVVNILAARECNGKTFRETLSTINNLSAIPGAKEIFGKELIAQAQGLSTSILTDLIDLIPHIKEAQTGTEIQGMALAKFSPASSDQAKLLRILTALDYLFDPKRTDPKSKDESFEGKEDLLTTLYESSTFGPLWAKLSECLSAIRQRDNMLNVATILLPLIEALMVVCKNTTLKDNARNVREFSVASPKPESGMEGLFFNFTEDHRKVLNELVRNNPKLMSGTFSLLVKNPKVLEFDNKRNYFSRRIHSRGAERHPQPPLQLAVRRDNVFLDSFKSLYFKTPDEMKYGKLSIRFHGEEGVDAGGVTREWFQVLARGMFNPNYALFVPVASDRTTFHPNRVSAINSEHLLFFKFIGRIIGKALYEGRVLDCHFSRAVYKRILGKAVSIKDMETLDLEYQKGLLWMLENDITDVITENFSLETDDFGESRIVDLIDNGRNVPVTEENKQEYVQLVAEYRLTGSVKEQLENFLKGFHDIIPAELVSIFNEQELELLISGLPDIDVDDWKNNSEYHNYSASSAQIQWFWRAVRSFDKEERAKLLQFVTGTSKVPLNGFKELEGMNGFSKFNIHRDYGNKDRLPSSHTCFNQLDLPEYETYEQLRQRLHTAMTTGGEYFGFA